MSSIFCENSTFFLKRTNQFKENFEMLVFSRFCSRILTFGFNACFWFFLYKMVDDSVVMWYNNSNIMRLLCPQAGKDGFLRILGIDPGYAIVGYGVVDYSRNRFSTVGCGAITTFAGTPFPKRLSDIYADMISIIKKYAPDELSIEKLYFNTNTTTAIEVAEARGVILLAAENSGIPIFEYTPLQVKSAITGYGRAEKRQVMEMVKSFLGLASVPKPDDTADALALAVCHGNYSGSSYSKLYSEVNKK